MAKNKDKSEHERIVDLENKIEEMDKVLGSTLISGFPFFPVPTEENPVIDLSDYPFSWAAGLDFKLVFCPYSFEIEVSVDNIIDFQRRVHGSLEPSWHVDKRAKRKARAELDKVIGNLHNEYICMPPCGGVSIKVIKTAKGSVGGYTGVAQYKGYGGKVIKGVHTYYIGKGFARATVKISCGE